MWIRSFYSILWAIYHLTNIAEVEFIVNSKTVCWWSLRVLEFYITLPVPTTGTCSIQKSPSSLSNIFDSGVGIFCMLSGRVLDSRQRGRWFEPHGCHCIVSLSKNINPSLVLVQPRKTCPFISERLLIGRKESNQTNKQNKCLWY